MFITQLITLHSISDIVSSHVYCVLYSYPRAMGTFTAIEHLATFSLAMFAGQEIAPITVITNAVIVVLFLIFSNLHISYISFDGFHFKLAIEAQIEVY